ncbi:integrase core domain-containing protein [Cyanobium sp. CH-040]|nr:integrase core domain-containing protein [Cyanobium sp. CH-040]
MRSGPCSWLLFRTGHQLPAELSDNGTAHQSGEWRNACTRPYTPRTNSNAERFIHTLLEEWVYGRAFQCSDEHNQ